MYQILNGRLQNLTPEEVTVIANIARYHRKSRPTKRHESFASLSKRGRKVVRVGAALLRIADGLDRSQCGVISSVRCKTGRGHVEILVKARGDAELELWGARRKVGLMAEVFDR